MKKDDTVYLQRFRSAVGEFAVAATDSAVVGVLLPGLGYRRFIKYLARKFPGRPVLEKPNELGNAARAEILEYLDGRRRDFDLPTEMNVTDFQRDVYEAMGLVPYGYVITYGELAAMAGYAGAARAVGAACAANPLPLLQPCHRVVAAAGPGGFGRNPKLKLALLKLEGARVSARKLRSKGVKR